MAEPVHENRLPSSRRYPATASTAKTSEKPRERGPGSPVDSVPGDGGDEAVGRAPASAGTARRRARPPAARTGRVQSPPA